MANVLTAALLGIDAVPVRVETQIFGSLRRFSIVGLPDGSVREARERVRCAVENSGFSFPHHEVIVSLAPAALPKSGAAFDLAIALSILAADGQLDRGALQAKLFLGELGLDGSVQSTPGVFAAAYHAERNGVRELVVPVPDAPAAAAFRRLQAFGVRSLGETVRYLNGELQLSAAQALAEAEPERETDSLRLGDIVGQHAAKRALEIATAGGHNLLLVGPPGSGKSMLARRGVTVLPPLSDDEALEVTRVHSSARVTQDCMAQRARNASGLLRRRPFRAPHHTTSTAGLIGGGSHPEPGEISLAHRGVLFLDELPEFRRECLESLRLPLETRHVVISRARMRVVYPADFILVAAMNPCPCGRRGSAPGLCQCSAQAVERYRSRVSGPILDRIDLQVWVPPVNLSEFAAGAGHSEHDPTIDVRKRVADARALQARRYAHHDRLNAQISTRQLSQFCSLTAESTKLLETAAERLHLTARGYARVLKVARTIADLEGAERISIAHLSEALSYRAL